MRTIQLVGPKVLIKKLHDVELTQGGIFLPSVARERSQLAKVLAVGRHWDGRSLGINVGEYVLYDHYIDYRTVTIDEVEYMILDHDDCVAAVWDVDL